MLKVELLGIPKVSLNGEVIDFPYKKVEALFYYLIVKKKVMREKVASLLWGDMLDSKAKKNLRNALYQLKKVVGDEILLTPDRFTIVVNDDYDLSLDLDVFETGSAQEIIQVYQGEFLNNFLIKNAATFTDWIFEERSYYRQLYISSLKNYINSLKDQEKLSEAIDHVQLLIKIDEFDEAAYRDLMKLHAKQGAIAKAVDTYKDLEKRLEQELGITPDKKTRQLLQKIRENSLNKIEDCAIKSNNFIAREKELKRLTDNLYRFLRDKESYSYLVTGEAGVGKTALVKQVLSMLEVDDCLVLKANCFQAEERYIFKPWQNILQQLKGKINFEQINTSLPWKKIISFLFPSFLAEEEELLPKEIFNFQSIQSQSAIEALIFLLKEAAKEKKLLFVFEDLQWCDDKSLFLLRDLIQEQEQNILVMATSRNERKERVERIFSNLKRYELMKEVKLGRLTLSETEELTQATLPNYNFSQEVLMKIYQETEGNTFFLVEALNLLEEEGADALSQLLTTKTKDILRNRVQSVSQEAQKILKLISVCFDQVSYDLLSAISGKNDLELIELLEELENHYLIEELAGKKGQGPAYKFTHSKIRQFIYKEQSFSRANLLHKRIAQLLEERLQSGVGVRDQYLKLIYHYSRAGDKLKQLEYLIKEAEVYFHHTHELFPVNNDKNLEKSRILSLNQDESRRYLVEIEGLLQEVEQEKGRIPLLRKMEVKFLMMRASFLICEGEYEQAISDVKEMITEAKSVDDWSSILMGYQKLVGIGIQKEDISLLEDNAEKMYNLAENMKNDVKMGLALRFLGIVKIYKKNYKAAERLFNQSLRTFKEAQTLGTKYTLSIAAVFNYLGEVKRHQGQFTEAINYYERGINLCEEQDILCGLGIFYTNAGQVLYQLKDYNKARAYFEKSLDIFGQLKTIWGYSTITNGFMALLSIRANNYEQAYQYLKTADAVIKQYHKRYWVGILYRVKAEIASKMRKDSELKRKFKDYLDQNYSDYAEQASLILEEIGANYEVKLVQGDFNKVE
ncbi:AAA family ATPase [Natroniella sulfidigena]|uniref:AAA family ATPase n=1 Tax=Natroniella sulfidigena TaxID=723921 RepID=UPI00200B2889|nr:AAA family ATPase [Natroniella sulfidigena]MCK8815825.1 AAA family ATPase [Natroniella sulfidigena]